MKGENFWAYQDIVDAVVQMFGLEHSTVLRGVTAGK